MFTKEEINVFSCEKYEKFKKIIPDLDFDEFVKLQPTLKILHFCNNMLNEQSIKASTVQKILNSIM